MKKKLVVLSGAGISAESGVKTFRDYDGLWENHDIKKVATPEAWQEDPTLVLRFYNERRQQLLTVKPNKAHFILAELEEHFDVHIITQNIDDLHERAGSTNVIHMHGELLKSRGVGYPEILYNCKEDISIGDLCKGGTQLRPDVVWFGERVNNLEVATKLVSECDAFLIIGTSMNVWPAAGLIYGVDADKAKIYVIDPIQVVSEHDINDIIHIKEVASKGMEIFKELLLKPDENCCI